jgi:uncharacterized surface protein with fasciclin (FAS1) repeats
MAALLAAAGLDAILASQPATIFAPTDAALVDSATAGLTLAAMGNSTRQLGDVVRCGAVES